MAEYYLISQLPSLDAIGDSTPLPITEERFTQLCESLLAKKVFEELKDLTLLPPIEPLKSKRALINSWNEGERDLRLALGEARAERLKKPFDSKGRNLPLALTKAASTAVDIENPLEAERYLLTFRLSFLETLRPTDGFSEDFIFYYALKLKLIMRIRAFDTEKGDTAYKNIYSSILNGDRLEA